MSDATAVKRFGSVLWLWLVPGGLAAIALGLVSIVLPDVTVALLGLGFGVWLVVGGLARVALASAMRAWPTWRRAVTGGFGGLLVLLGVTGIAGLFSSERLLATLIGFGFALAAAADLTIGLSGRGARGRTTPLVLAAINAAIAVVFLARPGAGLTFIAVVIGVVLVAIGIAQLVAAAVLRQRVNRFIDSAAARGPEPGEPREISVEIL